MKAPGFYFRLLSTAVILIGGSVFVMGYVGIGMMQNYVQARFEERNRFLVQNLASNAELGILLADEKMLGRLINNLVAEPDVIGVKIIDENKKTVVSHSKEKLPKHTISRAFVFSRSIQREGSAGLDSFQPDIASHIIGEVVIYFSLDEINSLQKSFRNTFALLSFMVALLAIVFFYLISRSLVNPVNKLARVAAKIASGNKNVRAEPDRIPETRELALTFNSMLDSLERSNEALETLYQDMAKQKTMAELGKFAMLIAHEVKNPLGIIKSSLDILKEEADLADNHPMVHYIEDEIRRISRLLEDFLSFSKPSAPVMKNIELNSLVSECVLRFELQSEAEQTEMDLDIDSEKAIANGDPDLLSKAVHNLLKNAMEANDGSGRIFIRTGIAGSKWFLEVEDQGVGVPLGLEDKIFEPFFTTKTKGSGLGLAFISYVTDAHGGSVKAYNKDSGGAVFRIEMEVVVGNLEP